MPHLPVAGPARRPRGRARAARRGRAGPPSAPPRPARTPRRSTARRPAGAPRTRPRSAAAASSRGSAPRSSARSPRAATRACGWPTCSPSPRASACAGSRAAQVGAVVLDECHHLASMWGYAVRVALAQLSSVDAPPHVVGLMATLLEELTALEFELYDELLGPVDFSVRDLGCRVRRVPGAVPGAGVVVRADQTGRAGLAGRARRPLPRAVTRCTTRRGPLSFPDWVVWRMRERRRYRRRRRGAVGAFQSRGRRWPGRAAVPGLGRAAAAGRRPARRGVPRGAGPRGLARAARGLGPAVPGASSTPPRRRYDAVGAALRELGSSSRAGGSAAARRRSTGCRRARRRRHRPG